MVGLTNAQFKAFSAAANHPKSQAVCLKAQFLETLGMVKAVWERNRHFAHTD